MDEKFLEKIEEEKTKIDDYQKWVNKADCFFSGFEYLNSQDMIAAQMKKLTHIGIRSLNESSELIRVMTVSNLDMIENVLKKVTTDIGKLTNAFNYIEKSINEKPGFFNRKNSSDIFIETFNAEQDNIRRYINDLKVKQDSLTEAKDTVKENINKIILQFIMLDRDASLLKKAKEEFSNSRNSRNSRKHLLNGAYEIFEFELNQIHTDILTQQQIIFQKYASLRLMQENILNCHHNITYLTRITSSCMLNMVELNHIISMNDNKDQNENALDKIKVLINGLGHDLKAIANKPFAKLIVT
jgi:hypothetical protein